MLKYDGQEVKKSLYVSEIKGAKGSYFFYSPATAENVVNLKGKNVIIIKSILNPEYGKNVENFYSIEYFEIFNGKKIDTIGIFNVYLKSFNSKNIALKVIKDLKN